jgi:beta-phosphoglucomutase-like phosphatase (HAD superfamily)
VSSEEVARGKPAPDVYLETTRRLGIPAQHAAAVEDSANGIRSALSAGTCVLGLPNPHYPPPPAVIEEVPLVLTSLDDLTVEKVMQADANRTGRIEHRLDEQEIESFPASDPHADWAGPV